MHEKGLLTALLEGRCPRCRTGKMFVHPASNLRHFNVMNPTCPHCGVRLEPEPGFYQGAMFVSYAITVAVICVLSLVLYYLAGHPPAWVYIAVVIGTMLLLVPLNYRFSRIIFLYAFGGLKYDRTLSR